MSSAFIDPKNQQNHNCNTMNACAIKGNKFNVFAFLGDFQHSVCP